MVSAIRKKILMEIQILNISLIKPNEMFTNICKYIITCPRNKTWHRNSNVQPRNDDPQTIHI